MPTRRFVANLGELSDTKLDDNRTALKTARAAKSVVLPGIAAPQPKSRANLDYLSTAVALETWLSLNMSAMLTEIMSEENAAWCAADVIRALTIRHCIAPGSKVQTQRWFPRTAIPRLLSVTLAVFPSTRTHRVLDMLDAIAAHIQDGLVRRCEHRDGALARLFANVTNTWFEGCTSPCRTQDSETLRDLVAAIEDRKWVLNVPSSSIVPYVYQAQWQGCGAASCASSPPCLDLISVATANDSPCRYLRTAHSLTCTEQRIRGSAMCSWLLDRALALLSCTRLTSSCTWSTSGSPRDRLA